MKKFFTNQIVWDIFMAVTSIVISGCYVYENKSILAICWAVIAGCNIAEAWLHTHTKE